MDDESMNREEVARFLNVSRPFVDHLIDRGDLPYLLDIRNGQRRVPTEAAEAYREAMKESQERGIEGMVESSAELGLYDDELEEARETLRRVGASEPAPEAESPNATTSSAIGAARDKEVTDVSFKEL